MRAPLKRPALIPIYVLSGSPHPDKPPMEAGKAAAIEAEDARLPPARARAAGFPPAGGVSVCAVMRETGTNLFQIPS